MKEQLISFDTAKLAKEKGFDISCQYYYDNDGNLPDRWESSGSSTDTDVPIYLEEFEENYNSNNWVGNIKCSAPTQSLLQKWLREVHELQVQCFPLTGGKWEGIIFYLNKPFNSYSFQAKMSHIWETDQYEWDSHEETLERGLYEALKLIPCQIEEN